MYKPLLQSAKHRSRLLYCLLCSIVCFSGAIQAQSVPFRLNDDLINEGNVADYQISSNSQYVVYRADQLTDGVDELFSVPIDLSNTAVRLNSVLTNQGNVTETFQISPDGNYVIYLADQNTDNVFELFSAPIDGSSAAVKLNGDLVSNGNVLSSFKISPDSSRVIYQADQNNNDIFELFSAPIDGSASASRLNSNLPSGGDVLGDFKISSDSSHVVYLADQNNNQVNELYSVPINGSANPTRLNTQLSGNRDVFPIFHISTNGQQVAYIADQNTNDIHELFSVSITGGMPIKISGNLTNGGDVLNFQYSLDDNYIVYLADRNTDETKELFSILLSNISQQTRLNGNLVSGGDVFSNYQISNSSTRVVYTSDQQTNNQIELYSVPINGGTARKLNSGLNSDGDVITYQLSHDDRYVVYLADQRADELNELFSTPLQGGSIVRLNSNLISNGDVSTRFVISPDSSQVIYSADQTVNEETELFRVPIRATSDPLKLNTNLPSQGRVLQFDITPDGQNVIYRGDQNQAEIREVFAVDVSMPLEPRPPVEDFCFPIKAQNGSVALVCL